MQGKSRPTRVVIDVVRIGRVSDNRFLQGEKLPMADAVDMTKTMAVAGVAAAILASLVRDKGFGEAKTMIPDAVGFAREIIYEASKSLRAKPLE
jgi:hypothetical protein